MSKLKKVDLALAVFSFLALFAIIETLNVLNNIASSNMNGYSLLRPRLYLRLVIKPLILICLGYSWTSLIIYAKPYLYCLTKPWEIVMYLLSFIFVWMIVSFVGIYMFGFPRWMMLGLPEIVQTKMLNYMYWMFIPGVPISILVHSKKQISKNVE